MGEKVNLIEKFINDNKLDFSGSGSDLNGNCVILAGYACYLELTWDELCKGIWPDDMIQPAIYEELQRVFDYAQNHNYGEQWKDPNQHKVYVYPI
jgi:hypothetical protein